MPTKKAQCQCQCCKKNVTKTQHSVWCALCKMYYHIECVGVSEEQHKLFCKNKKVFSFICPQCSNRTDKPANVVESQASLEPHDDLNQSLHNLTMELEKQFEEHSRMFEQQVYASIAALDAKMVEIFDKFRAEQKAVVENIQLDVTHNYDIMKKVDEAASRRICSLERQNSILQRRLNRSNIVIKGLPKNIKELREVFIKIASLCNIFLSKSDIQHITYFSNGKAVLVKLTSVQTRDEIMSNFSKLKYLLLKDIDGGISETKVFLNDHFTPDAANLISNCRKLRDAGLILGYKFINTDVPRVNVLFPNNIRKVLDMRQCLDMLNENLISDIENGSVSRSPNGNSRRLCGGSSNDGNNYRPCRRSCEGVELNIN